VNIVRYRTEVRRRRGEWHVSVPALPRDAPVIKIDKLGNAAPLLVEALAGYLGVAYSAIEVSVNQPVRRTLRSRVTAGAVQLAGAVGTLSGLYLLAGVPATLIAASVATVAVGTLREMGRI